MLTLDLELLRTLSLVQEYLDLIDEFGLPRLPSSQGKEDSRSRPARRPIPGAAIGTEPRTTDGAGATAPGRLEM